MKRLIPHIRATAAWVLLSAGAAPLWAATPDDTLASLQSAFMRSVTPGEQADSYRELFANVLHRVQRSHVKEADFDAFARAALKVLDAVPPASGEPLAIFKKSVNEALRTLDAHSRYVDPQAQANDGTAESGFGGLGLEVEPKPDGVGVLASLPGTPAARAGLRTGDVIVRVDTQAMAGFALADAIALLRGTPGTPVSITYRRSQDEFTISLTRETIRRRLLRWSMEGDVLVLRLGTFSGAVTAALERAVAEATATGVPRGIVLDLRGNPGGLLREAVTFTDAFLSHGEIVSVRGRTPAGNRAWTADAKELLPGVPMVVLIDARSASASEIVAAALQENGRAKVMGQRSFGKGTVQTTYTLGERKGALKLTTSTFHSPSGRSVQQGGVAPDIVLIVAEKKPDVRVEGAPAAGASIDPARCASVVAVPDAAVSCAVGFLRAGSVDLFIALFGDLSP